MAQIFALYVVYQDGRTIVQKDFQLQDTEADLVTGFLSAVTMFLSDLVGRLSEEGKRLHALGREDGRLRIIDREDVKILLEYGRNIYVAVFATHDLPAIRQRMNRLVTEIESRFAVPLENWQGDLRMFRPIFPIMDALFRPFAVSERYVPVQICGVPARPLPPPLRPLFDAIDNKRSVEDLAEHLQLPLLRVALGVQALADEGAVRLDRRVAIEQLVGV
jgi:hypothetical protein